MAYVGPVYGASFVPDPPVGASSPPCFWNTPVLASEPCGGELSIEPGFWDAASRLGVFTLAVPSAAPVLTSDIVEYEDYPWGVQNAVIYGSTLYFDVAPEAGYSGEMNSLTFVKCSAETGEILDAAFWTTGAITWMYDTHEYALTGVPELDSGFAWYASMNVDLVHDTSGPPINGTVYLPIIVPRSVVLNSINAVSMGDLAIDPSEPFLVGTTQWFGTLTTGMYKISPEEDYPPVGATGTVAIVTIDGVEYTVTFDDVGAG